MKYSTIRYNRAASELFLTLYSFDGTCRRVWFQSEDEASAALATGRAEADTTAIEKGMLPRGATLVSSAEALDPKKVLAQLSGQSKERENLLGTVRLGFSQKLIVNRSRSIDVEQDAAARHNRPEDAKRYEALVDAVERANANGGLF